jgi:hypothetical protein
VNVRLSVRMIFGVEGPTQQECDLALTAGPRNGWIGSRGGVLQLLSGRHPISITMRAKGAVLKEGRPTRFVRWSMQLVRLRDCRV